MFEIGEHIVYGMKGVCRIEDITHIDISGADAERLYYVLAPVEDGSGKIYAPTDQTKIIMRRILSKEESEELIRELSGVAMLSVPEERMREAIYKEALNTCDCRTWAGIAKTLRRRREERIAQGKKSTALDERYLRAAENGLYGELSLSLGIPRDEMEEYMTEWLEQE